MNITCSSNLSQEEQKEVFDAVVAGPRYRPETFNGVLGVLAKKFGIAIRVDESGMDYEADPIGRKKVREHNQHRFNMLCHFMQRAYEHHPEHVAETHRSWGTDN